MQVLFTIVQNFSILIYMELNYTLILVATILQFILGAVWYSPLMFGKWWMEIMEVAHIPKEELKKMQKEMTPFYLLQLVLTITSTTVLAMFLQGLPSLWNPYGIAFFVLLGFIVPTQVSGVVWANTKKKFWVKQIFVMVSMQLVGIMLATWILTM
jgi:hypothetical protein